MTVCTNKVTHCGPLGSLCEKEMAQGGNKPSKKDQPCDHSPTMLGLALSHLISAQPLGKAGELETVQSGAQ